MGKYTWESDENAELWKHDCFDTIEDCITDAVENYGYHKGETIYIGETLWFEVCVDATIVLEDLEEEAYDFAGESAENWNTFNYKEDNNKVEELSKQLTDVVNNWLKTYKKEPDFYQINNIKSVKI